MTDLLYFCCAEKSEPQHGHIPNLDRSAALNGVKYATSMHHGYVLHVWVKTRYLPVGNNGILLFAENH